jgi:hypothetical protein
MKFKKSLVSLALLRAWLVKASVALIVAITILIIGGIIIYLLVNICKQVLGGSSGNGNTNNVASSSSYEINYYGPATNYLGEVWGALSPYTYNNSSLNEPQDEVISPLQNGFTLQYGLDDLNNPWVSAGQSLSNQVINMQVLENDSTNYTVAFTEMGITTIYSATTNTADSGVYEDATNGMIDADGDEVWVITNQPTSVVIERSTNMVIWTPIYTNIVTAGAVQNFTDSTIFNSAFYRIMR